MTQKYTFICFKILCAHSKWVIINYFVNIFSGSIKIDFIRYLRTNMVLNRDFLFCLHIKHRIKSNTLMWRMGQVTFIITSTREFKKKKSLKSNMRVRSFYEFSTESNISKANWKKFIGTNCSGSSFVCRTPLNLNVILSSVIKLITRSRIRELFDRRLLFVEIFNSIPINLSTLAMSTVIYAYGA